MCRLIESIKCKDGKLFNIDYHNFRLNKSRKELFGASNLIDLKAEIAIPVQAKKGTYKCRVLYTKKIENVEYTVHQYRKIKSLKLIDNNEISYNHKFENRTLLNNLFEKRGDCDDILIVKNGLITDSSPANVIFFDGEKWWTPETPLLPGTQRSRLLDEGKIFQSSIKPNDLIRFKKAGLINAMQNLITMPVIPIENIQ